MIIMLAGPPVSGFVHSVPTLLMLPIACRGASTSCAMLPANLMIWAALILGLIAGAWAKMCRGAWARRLVTRGLLGSMIVLAASSMVIGAFYWSADPINLETEYPTLGPYFDLANWLFGVSLLTLSMSLGARLGFVFGRERGSGVAS